jgi:hypothetical protein
VFPKEMIYKKELSFGRKTRFAKNMMLCMNACNAQRSGEDYAPDTPMLGRGNKVA